MQQSPPPTPQEAMKASLKQHAQNEVRDRLRDGLLRRTPRMLHGFIPGSGRSVEGDLKREAERRISGVIFSIVFFLVFASIVLLCLLFVVSIVVYAVVMA